jgi:hypothetical protein
MYDIRGPLKGPRSVEGGERIHQRCRKGYYGNKDDCLCVATWGRVGVISHVARGRHRRVQRHYRIHGRLRGPRCGFALP